MSLSDKRRIKISLNNPLPLAEFALASASPFMAFQDIVSPDGKLHFAGKASIDKDGITFKDGKTYAISLPDMKVIGLLGKGQYGVVQKIIHRPTSRIMGPIHLIVAMKEIRLELDKSKLDTIIMELAVLNSSKSPFIIDFYGAFYIESCIYICTEFMDAGKFLFI